METDAERLARLMQFPAAFTFQVIAAASPDLADRCATAACAALGRPVAGVEERPSSRGRWIALHIATTVHSAEEVVAVYAALAALDGVRLLL